jgi:uroporphyrinogen-III synthase
LDKRIIAQAAGQGIMLEALSFIKTEPIREEELGRTIKALSNRPVVVVFTSKNAVDAVANWLEAGEAEAETDDSVRPASGWKIFCIGAATRKRVSESFGEAAIEGSANSALSLADTILTRGSIKETVFFCGDQRRDELPEKLKQHHMGMREIVVYKTIRTPHKIEQTYDGIAFFSPSAVFSFFSGNALNKETILFAIGGTTAAAIRSRSGNKLIISESPDKEALVRQAIDYFQRKD